MQTPGDFGTRKRRHIDQHCQLGEASGLATKRQKVGHLENNERPPAFWDGLSTIPLTKGALKELERRNAENLHPSSRTTSKSPKQSITKGAAADWKSKHRLFKPLSQPSSKEKRFARQGGPDLTDLRGVRRINTS